MTLEDVLAATSAHYPPHVSHDGDETALEWWKGDKTVAVFLRPEDPEVIRLWGPGHMRGEALVEVEQVSSALAWLHGDA